MSQIRGSFPATSVAWGIALDVEGRPWFIPTTGYNWNEFLAKSSAPNGGVLATAAGRGLEFLDSYRRSGEAQTECIKVNRALFTANNWNNRRFWENGYTYSPGDGGYNPGKVLVTAGVSPDTKLVQPFPENGFSTYYVPLSPQVDKDATDWLTVKIPLKPELQQIIMAAGYQPIGDDKIMLYAVVNKWTRVGYFSHYNIDVTTRTQLDLRALNRPDKVASMVGAMLSLIVSAVAGNIPGMLAAVAGLGLTIGGAIGAQDAVVSAAIQAEGVIPIESAKTAKEVTGGIGINEGTSPGTVAKQIVADSEGGFPWGAIAVAAGGLLLVLALG